MAAVIEVRRVALPEVLYRVTDWYAGFDPRPPSPAIGAVPPREDESGRWDSPGGTYRTLYCATEVEGAIGEKLGPFALNPEAVANAEAFLDGEPDPEFADDTLATGLTEEDVEALSWRLWSAPAEHGSSCIDMDSPRTYLALLPRVPQLLKEFGLRAFDRRALLDERRNFTRQLADSVRASVTDTDGRVSAQGLRYSSRLPPAWECWALWDPVPVRTYAARYEPVSIHMPAFRSAAAQLGVVLFD